MVIADRVFFPALFHDFLLFVFCLSGYCAGVGKNPKTVSSLGSICNSSINCLHISNNRRFGQIPRMETGTLHGISNPPLTTGNLRCVPVSITDAVAPQDFAG